MKKLGPHTVISTITFIVFINLLSPTLGQEKGKYSFDDAWNEELEKKGVIQLNPDDPTYALPFKLRDPSKGPQREPGAYLCEPTSFWRTIPRDTNLFISSGMCESGRPKSGEK